MTLIELDLGCHNNIQTIRVPKMQPVPLSEMKNSRAGQCTGMRALRSCPQAGETRRVTYVFMRTMPTALPEAS